MAPARKQSTNAWEARLNWIVHCRNLFLSRKSCNDRVWSIQGSGSSDPCSGICSCSENVNVEYSTQILSTYVVYTSTEGWTVSDMIAPVMEPHTNRSGYQCVHFVSRRKRPRNNSGYALVWSNCATTCNGRENMPTDSWGKTFNAPGHTRERQFLAAAHNSISSPHTS